MGHPPLNTNPTLLSLPTIALLTGNAGTGKSVVIKTISDFCEHNNIGIFKTAFNAINVLHIGGNTTVSAVNFSARDQRSTITIYTQDELMRFRQISGIGDPSARLPVCLIMFDEVSTQGP